MCVTTTTEKTQLLHTFVMKYMMLLEKILYLYSTPESNLLKPPHMPLVKSFSNKVRV